MDDLNENAPVQRGNAAGGSENHLRADLQSDSTDSRGQSGAILGADLRDEGVARANESGDAWWRSCCDAAIAYLAAQDGPFSADHVLELVPPPDRPCRMGGRFHAAVRAGVIRPVGFVLSDRPSRRRGVQRLYRGGAAR